MSSKDVLLGVGNVVRSGQPNLILHIDDESLDQWNRQIATMIEVAGEGAEELAQDMINTVYTESQKLVPTDTFTLYNSAYKKLEKQQHYYLARQIGGGKSYESVTGIVGYGDNSGGPNPITGIYPSAYAWKVHEDLSTKHPNGGQAKFLERAYREYIASELGPAMITLERCIYQAKKYTPVIHYTDKSRSFSGQWERKRRNKRTKENVTNLDKLSKIYEQTIKR